MQWPEAVARELLPGRHQRNRSSVHTPRPHTPCTMGSPPPQMTRSWLVNFTAPSAGREKIGTFATRSLRITSNTSATRRWRMTPRTRSVGARYGQPLVDQILICMYGL